MKTVMYFCIILLFALSCTKSNNVSVNKIATEFFPNKIGDRWVYLVNDTTVNRGSQDSVAVQYNLTVDVIDSIRLPGGIKANVWVYKYPGKTDTNYVFVSGDTIRFVDINQTVYSTYAKQYIIPLVLHNSWPYSIPSFQNINVDSQSGITVGQNHFDNAFHIYGNSGMPDAGFVIDEWLANNTGVVKRYYNPSGMLIDPRHVIAWTLVSYNLR